jgi:hypothetical protein
MDAAEIVKQLATCDPRGTNGFCTLCGKDTSPAVPTKRPGSEHFESPDIVTKHDETCPYRLAKNWVERAAQ